MVKTEETIIEGFRIFTMHYPYLSRQRFIRCVNNFTEQEKSNYVSCFKRLASVSFSLVLKLQAIHFPLSPCGSLYFRGRRFSTDWF